MIASAMQLGPGWSLAPEAGGHLRLSEIDDESNCCYQLYVRGVWLSVIGVTGKRVGSVALSSEERIQLAQCLAAPLGGSGRE